MSVLNLELVKTVDDSYQIEIGFSLEEKLVEDVKAGLLGSIRKFAIVTDSNVKELHGDKIVSLLEDAGYTAKIFVFEAGEKSKTRKTKEYIEDAMLEAGFRRDCAIIAVGGGVVTDLAGFVAGTFGRGIPFVNYATTLLAAADASVGGKTAVDTPLATNLIGLFNQPKKVYIDVAAWKTLDMRQLRSGVSETIKHACLADSEFFEYLEEHMEDLLNNDKQVCEHVALKNCSIKYKVVMQDERESGLREVLNLGHTVGRAIETVSDYELLHGEALAIGMVAMAQLSKELGYMNEEEVDKVIGLYKKAGLPISIPDYIDREVLVKKLYTDKKVKNGQLRFVIEKGIGQIATFGENVYAKPIEEELARKIINKI